MHLCKKGTKKVDDLIEFGRINPFEKEGVGTYKSGIEGMSKEEESTLEANIQKIIKFS